MFFFFFSEGASKGHGFPSRSGITMVSYVLPPRSPALASKNKCLINAFSDHLKGSLPLTPRLFQNKTIIQRAHTQVVVPS